MLYHAGIKRLSGGFTGVDVFFVISGFLITSIIYSDIQKGRFSIATFYERRIRRIIPALSVMLACCIVVSFLVLMPDEFREFGKSVAAATLFVSNILFAQDSGYFAGAASEKPLLHTWSVAVEEQFYIFYPILLFLAWRYLRRYLAPGATAVLLLSFLIGLWAVKHAPIAAFYLAPMRAWELMLGAILAFGVVPLSTSRVVNNLLSLLGIMLIVWGVFTISSQTAFPGPSALYPCLGSALIIYAGGPASGATMVGSLLSAWPLRAIGLISYSLYLWHWPLLLFAKYYAIRPMTPAETFGVVGLAVVISALSWRYIEQPFRGKTGAFSRKAVFVGAGGLMVLFLGAGIAIARSRGLPSRLPADVVRFMRADQGGGGAPARCFPAGLEEVVSGQLCRIGDRGGAPPAFVLWGDSHAMSMLPGLQQSGAANHRVGLFAARDACPPLLGVHRPAEAKCAPFNDGVLALIMRTESIRLVFLVARWALPAEGQRYTNEPGDEVFIRDDSSRETSFAENRRAFARGLERTVSQLTGSGRRVIVMAQAPEVGYPVALTLARMRLFGKSIDIRPTRASYLNRQKYVLQEIGRLVDKYGATGIFPHDLLCGSLFCEITVDEHLLYSDGNHLSPYGSRYVARLLDPLFQD